MNDQNQPGGFPFGPEDDDLMRSYLYRGDYETYWRIKGAAWRTVIIFLIGLTAFVMLFRPLG